jgi:hypothetical protein
MQNGKYIGYNGKEEWFKDDLRHREDGPAIEWFNGDKLWYLNGELHRVDGPARELSNGSKAWYLNGQRHREYGPAMELSNGTKRWYLNDEMIYSDNLNDLHLYKDLSESFKMSIVKYELSK